MTPRRVIVADTARLSLRRFTPDDLALLLELDSDPEVMRYINGGVPQTRAQVEAALARIQGYYERGDALGLWAAELKTTGAFIGWFSLKPLPGWDDVEIGYRLLKRHWGRGYATEGAACMLARGFGQARLSRVVAIVDPGNAASRRVIEKTGLRYERRTQFTSPITGQVRPVDLFAALRPAAPAR